LATFNDIKMQIRYMLSEETAITFTDEELFEYVKEGAKMLYGIISTINPSFLLTTPYSTSVTSLTPIISLPSNCMFINYIMVSKYDVNGTFVGLTALRNTLLPEAKSAQNCTGDPSVFSRLGNSIMIGPLPDASTTDTYTLEIYYVPSYTVPTTMDTDLGLADMFIPFVIEYVGMRAHNRNNRQTLVEQIFLNQKGQLIQSLLNQESQTFQVIPTLTNPPYSNLGW